jgi:hypothetical protein
MKELTDKALTCPRAHLPASGPARYADERLSAANSDGFSLRLSASSLDKINRYTCRLIFRVSFPKSTQSRKSIGTKSGGDICPACPDAGRERVNAAQRCLPNYSTRVLIKKRRKSMPLNKSAKIDRHTFQRFAKEALERRNKIKTWMSGLKT